MENEPGQRYVEEKMCAQGIVSIWYDQNIGLSTGNESNGQGRARSRS